MMAWLALIQGVPLAVFGFALFAIGAVDGLIPGGVDEQSAWWPVLAALGVLAFLMSPMILAWYYVPTLPLLSIVSDHEEALAEVWLTLIVGPVLLVAGIGSLVCGAAILRGRRIPPGVRWTTVAFLAPLWALGSRTALALSQAREDDVAPGPRGRAFVGAVLVAVAGAAWAMVPSFIVDIDEWGDGAFFLLGAVVSAAITWSGFYWASRWVAAAQEAPS